MKSIVIRDREFIERVYNLLEDKDFATRLTKVDAIEIIEDRLGNKITALIDENGYWLSLLEENTNSKALALVSAFVK
jgi:hypothetical protein